MKYAGLPGWLFAEYPQVLATDLAGKPRNRHLSVSYLHPVFLEKVEAWYRTVCPSSPGTRSPGAGPWHLCSMLEYLLGKMGAGTATVQCDNPCVWTVLRTDGQRAMLFAMNLFSAPQTARASVARPGCGPFDTGPLTLAPMEVRTFVVA